MTNITALQNCERCGGKLVPPELMPVPAWTDRAKDPPDYVCSTCGETYRWVSNPPRLAKDRPR